VDISFFGFEGWEIDASGGDTEENGLRLHRGVAEIAEVRGERKWDELRNGGCGLGAFEEA
jgi:hypothetical protein